MHFAFPLKKGIYFPEVIGVRRERERNFGG